MKIKINCDMGESYGIWKMGADEQIMPHIDFANLACGFHASDSNTMNKAVSLAKKNKVLIGAHPSYPDILGFGRRSIKCSKEEIENIVLNQLGALNAFCIKHNTEISYVKPHGALYNDMMKDKELFEGILKAIKIFNPKLMLMILSSPNNDYYKKIAKEFGIDLLYEVFADRNYTKDGSLVPRSDSKAVLHEVSDIAERIKILKESKYIKTIEGKKLYIQADTVCVHSDNPNALDFIKKIKEALDAKV